MSPSIHAWSLSPPFTHQRARKVKPKEQLLRKHWYKIQAVGKSMAPSGKGAEILSAMQSSLAHKTGRCSLQLRLDGKCTEKRYSKLHAALQTSQNIRTGMYGKLADRTRETKWNKKLIQPGHQTLSQCTHIVISIPDSKKIQFLKIQHKNQISRGETYKRCKRALPRKIIKTLLREIRVSTSWRDIPCSWIRRVTISNQNSSSFLMRIDKLILKFK